MFSDQSSLGWASMDGPSSTDATNTKLKTILIDGRRKGINSKDEGFKVLSIFA